MARVPIILRVANCQGVSEADPADEARRALTKPGPYGLPDVVLLSEVSWLDARRLATDLGMWCVQDGGRGDPEAGVAVVARAPLRSKPPLVGSRPVPGVRMRPIIGARAFGVTWWAVHAPPPRTPVARAAYIARARARRGVVGGDFNMRPEEMVGRSRRQYRGIGVLGVLVPRNLRVSQPRPVDIGSDHPAVDVVVTIPARDHR